MTFRSKTCIEIVCDGGPCEPWYSGTSHFDTEAAAIEQARYEGWIVLPDGRAWCRRCAEKVDCTVTGHQWQERQPATHHGVAYRRRWCGRCSVTDFDPPHDELATALDVAKARRREAERRQRRGGGHRG
ncbi:hypothetical protein [Polymorphospora lycopeni]|uniref:4Fe-4S Wbl-type domain-containing protein n=1 Tax=Polymorphospora lycopeni TaxID=3140240 RepID=A0ABV5CKP0_9ACTN